MNAAIKIGVLLILTAPAAFPTQQQKATRVLVLKNDEAVRHQSKGKATTLHLRGYTKSIAGTITADFITHFMFLIQTMLIGSEHGSPALTPVVTS